jgi:hypothetical protein
MTLSDATTSVVQSKVVYDDDAEAHDFTRSQNTSDLYREVFGEKVTSFREYLHRSSISVCAAYPLASSYAGIARTVVPFKRMPLPPGVYNNGWWTGSTISGPGQRVNFSKFHPILTVGACFAGYKGSVNVTVNIDQDVATQDIDTLQIVRVPQGSGLSSGDRRPQNTALAANSYSTSVIAELTNKVLYSGVTGVALTNTKTNAGLSVQLPYYSSSAFQLMDMYNEYNNGDLLTNANNDWWQLEWRETKNATSDSLASLYNIYYATGPDFDFVFFVNVPVLSSVDITPS